MEKSIIFRYSVVILFIFSTFASYADPLNIGSASLQGTQMATSQVAEVAASGSPELAAIGLVVFFGVTLGFANIPLLVKDVALGLEMSQEDIRQLGQELGEDLIREQMRTIHRAHNDRKILVETKEAFRAVVQELAMRNALISLDSSQTLMLRHSMALGEQTETARIRYENYKRRMVLRIQKPSFFKEAFYALASLRVADGNFARLYRAYQKLFHRSGSKCVRSTRGD